MASKDEGGGRWERENIKKCKTRKSFSPFNNHHCHTKCFFSINWIARILTIINCYINLKKKCVVLFGFFTYSKEQIGVNKDCASEIRCRVSFAVLSVSSAVLVLPQLQWELTITTEMFFFFTLAFRQMDLRNLKIWKLQPSPSIKRYLPSFSQRELQETQIHLVNFTGVIDIGITRRAFYISITLHGSTCFCSMPSNSNRSKCGSWDWIIVIRKRWRSV